MSSVVRNKIASYEAHSKQGRRSSASKSTSSAENGYALSAESANSQSQQASTGPHLDAGSSRSNSQQQRSTTTEMNGDSAGTTALAAQNRISRMRQEQSETRDGKSHQQTPHAIEKRKLLKERRLQHQKRTNSTADKPLSESTRTPVAAHVDLARRTEYPSRRPVPPEQDSADAPPETRPQHAEAQVDSQTNSHGRRSTSRMAKVQRMQKSKGYNDHVKTGSQSKPAALISSSSTKATATVARNVSTKNALQRRQRQTSLRQNRVKRENFALQNTERATTAHTKVNLQEERPATYNLSPTTNGTTLVHTHMVPSPVSDTDGPATDHSLDPTTDDEATLTSVRRIMTKENNESPRDASHHYHHLQAQSSQHENSARSSKRSGRMMQDSNPRFESSSDANLSRKGGREYHPKWPQEDKAAIGGSMGVFRTSSSSDYDTDGDISKTSRQSNALQGPSQSQATDVDDFFAQSRYSQGNRRMDDDDRTFDYGDRDDDSHGSTSFLSRRRREVERSKRDAPPNGGDNADRPVQANPSVLINKEDVKHYTKSIGTPAMKVGAGVLGAVAVGCLVLGPLGLLAGAAIVGVGVGVLQIPEEERGKLQEKVQKSVSKAHEKAIDATEAMSNSCASTYEESGVAEHLPSCLSATENGVSNDRKSTKSEKRGTASVADDSLMTSKGNQKQTAAPQPQQEAGSRSEPVHIIDRPRNKKVACLRNARILPASQIHSLDPTAQPKAWLDVVASAHTSMDEKNEAMEEILILAKDKRRARILLDEGILDSILWTMDRYFEKSNCKEYGWNNLTVTPNEKRAVKLAALCCVTLGKTHCAAIHTEGDLQLMSLYERGTVPEERQVAQMLHEVAHHVRITKTFDPTIVEPSKEVFALRQLGLHQAEDLARSIKSVADES